MRKGKKTGDLLSDYYLLEKMSKELTEYQEKMAAVGKRIAKKSIRTDLEDGLIENLEIVSKHISNAKSEIDKAAKKLRMI
ncbi:MAG: hypothetical protein ACYCO0_00305 [Candidatus Micrarchaeaceae archaeon]